MRRPLLDPASPLPSRPTPDEIAAHRPFHRLVRRILIHGGVREPDVEDRHQNVFLAVLLMVDSERAAGREVSSMERLLSRVAIAQVAEHHRARAVRGSVMPYEDDGAAGPDSTQGIPTPHRAVALKERAGALELLLERMEPKLRAVFILVEIEEMGVQDAADVLELPHPTVKGRLTRARKRFEALKGPVRAEIEQGGRRVRRG
jgi:RNA polymerase sigma factor (sigma-70 family)